MIVMLSRKEVLGQAFVAAGERGLTGRQMQMAVGGNWSRWLGELKVDGWMFREDPSRYGRRGDVFRWVLRYEPSSPTAAVPEPDVRVQLALLDARVGARPASALEAA